MSKVIVNVENLVKEINLHSNSMNENAQLIKKTVTNALLKAIKDIERPKLEKKKRKKEKLTKMIQEEISQALIKVARDVDISI